jgi:TonB family protein
MVRAISSAILLNCLVAPFAAAQTEVPPVHIIVHPSNDVPAMPKAEMSDLFLGKTAEWPDGRAVTTVDQASTSAVRDPFCRYVHGRSATSVTQFWTRAVLAGRAQAPMQFESDEAVLAYVRDHPTAVGYVSRGSPLDGVRELFMVPRPKRIKFVEPQYTRMAKRAKLFGVVIMRLRVGEDGTVTDVDVIQHLEMGLSESAAKAARSWTYEPTLVDAKPVEVMLEERVRFDYFG